MNELVGELVKNLGFPKCRTQVEKFSFETS